MYILLFVLMYIILFVLMFYKPTIRTDIARGKCIVFILLFHLMRPAILLAQNTYTQFSTHRYIMLRFCYSVLRTVVFYLQHSECHNLSYKHVHPPPWGSLVLLTSS